MVQLFLVKTTNGCSDIDETTVDVS